MLQEAEKESGKSVDGAISEAMKIMSDIIPNLKAESVCWLDGTGQLIGDTGQLAITLEGW